MLLNADRKVRHTGWISSGPPDSAALIAGVIAAHTRDLSALALGSSPVGVFLTYSFFDLLWGFFVFFFGSCFQGGQQPAARDTSPDFNHFNRRTCSSENRSDRTAGEQTALLIF